jgi:hypothetical protein
MMKSFRRKQSLPLLAGWLMLSLCAAHAFAGDMHLSPTRFYIECDGKEYQAIRLAGGTLTEEDVSVTGPSWEANYEPDSLQRFQGGYLVPVPPVNEPAVFSIDVPGVGSATVEVRPQRKWVVYLTPHTHLDIGFTERQDLVWERMAANLSNVIRMCEETRDWPVGSQYRWTIEVSALFENFIEKADPAEGKKLVELIHQGRVELAGLYMNLLTELCSPEELARSLYPAERFREKFGIPVRTAMLDDVPGYTWALPQLLSGAGIEFLSLRANPVRAKFLWYRDGAVERPFIWESPDGSRILTWYTDSYREANPLRGGFSETLWRDIQENPDHSLAGYGTVLGYINRVESTGYPLSVVQMRMGGDNMEATLTPCHYVREWNERIAYPRLVMATNRDFHRALLETGHEFPVYRGDIPDWWADGAASTAKQTGEARVLQDRLADVERLEVMADLLTGLEYEPLRPVIDEAYRQLMLYDEHTWGSSGGGWQRDPEAAEEQWKIKRGYVEKAEILVRSAEQKLLRRLRDRVPAGPNSIVVFNSLPWPRTGPVRTNLTHTEDVMILTDAESGEEVYAQTTGESNAEYVFPARDVPPFGYKMYRVRGPAGDVRITAEGRPTSSLEPFPEIRFDSTGAITSLQSSTLGRDIVNPDADYPFDQYIYESGGVRQKVFPFSDTEDKLHPQKDYSVPEATAEVEIVADGPVFTTRRTVTRGPRAKKLVREITTFADYDTVLITNTIDKEDTMDPEGLFFSFPFAIEEPVVRAEIPYTWMRPERDQLSYSARDFYSIFHGVDVSGKDGGVTLVPIEAPLVMFGNIRTDEWSDTIDLDSGTVFSYFMNNYWFTNYRFHQGGRMTFRYAIRPHAGQFDPATATRFGWETGCPLRAFACDGEASAAPSRWLMKVFPANVVLSTVKRAHDGNGYILRLHEAAGTATRAKLEIPKGYTWIASETDVVENNIASLNVSQSGSPTLEMELPPHAIRTIRVTPSQ